jgi:hypothetical protein
VGANSMGKRLNIEALKGSITRGAPNNLLTAFGVFTPDTQGMSVGTTAGVDPASQTCTLGTIHQIGAGLIHAEYACPALIGNGNTDACSAAGTFVFEYCQVE